MTKNILIVSPHPDDETLGAGGIIIKHKEEGTSDATRIYWCNITNVKVEYGFSEEDVKRRNEEIKQVISMYGFNGFFNFELKPSSLTDNEIPILIENFSKVINKVKPNILYIPFFNDPHSDHRVVFKALYPFFKSFRYPFIKKILMMEIISETDNQFTNPFKPNVFVDISDYIEKKLQIISIYKSELGIHPFPRSLENIKNLAAYRGSQCNCKYAESFMLLKEIW
ncbi:GlcNAc-PI de-N-acetylase [Dissulfurispira thermophila]|uniref:GlcNAc-PI de-N-acetylase n=1 Tax=Dissulfurispira thermophila TaxID=2715679 RepID=A0A7G1H2G4_9BACT|nr:PIG-L family deacetylase [Dissulfurispira thermophila]BCB96331.1 GlcNAc-PI de-N-acetylase [Dissulfurispira thermophila]